MHICAIDPSIYAHQIDDREIDTSHTCIRFEFELRQKLRQLYDKLLNGIQLADCSKWCLFGSAALPKDTTTIHPEIEFITYEHRGEVPSIIYRIHCYTAIEFAFVNYVWIDTRPLVLYACISVYRLMKQSLFLCSCQMAFCKHVIYHPRMHTDNIKNYLEPHVDNESVLTLILLLSNPKTDFSGGQLLFEQFYSDAESCDSNYYSGNDNVCHHDETWRSVHLDIGDAVLFRGSQVLHTITPLLSGTRSILQIELSVEDFDE